jgi:hypothetical protein
MADLSHSCFPERNDISAVGKMIMKALIHSNIAKVQFIDGTLRGLEKEFGSHPFQKDADSVVMEICGCRA